MTANTLTKERKSTDNVEVDGTLKVAAVVADTGLTSASKLIDVNSKLYQKTVGVFATFLSKQVYDRYRPFMQNPTVVQTQLILVGILQFFVYIFSAIFSAIDTMLYALANYLAALIQSKFGADMGSVTRSGLRVLIAGLKIWVSISVMGLKGILTTFIVLFILSVITSIKDPDTVQPPPEKTTLPSTSGSEPKEPS